MSYHHYNRLTSHWPEGVKKLSPAAKFIAATIAQHINQTEGSWKMSAKTLSSWTGGLHRSTIDPAVKKLEELGVFEITRAGKRSPREFHLLVECPQGCDRRQDHNTPNELKALAITRKAMPNLETTEQGVMPNLQTPMPNLQTPMPNLQATNKESIKTNKKDEADSFEFLLISETLQHLKETNKFNSGHAELSEALQDNPQFVIDRARAILNKEGIQNPKSYLKGSITNHPGSLIQRPGKDEIKGFTSELEKQHQDKRIKRQYEKFYQDNPDELIELSPYDSVWLFLLKVCPTDLTITAARVASKAAYYGVNINSCKSLTQAGEITAHYEKVPGEQERARRSKEAKRKALEAVETF